MRLRSLAIALPALLAAAPAFAQSPSIWQGVYLGVHAGGSWGEITGPFLSAAAIKAETKGAVAGVHGGYNWQSGTFVFGVEGDLGFSGAEGTATDGTKLESSYLATLRARAGIASGPALFYVTGGAAFTNMKLADIGFSEKHSLSGWVIGGGIEYMFSKNMALRVEGLHHEFDADKLTDDGKYKVNVLRAGLSYKF